MTEHEWVAAIIASAISIPAAMLAAFLYDPIGKWRGRRDKSSAIKQTAALKAGLEEIERYRSDPGEFQVYLLARLLFIITLWIGQEVVDSVIGAATNIQYGLNANDPASLTAAGQALLASILLTVVGLIGIHAYGIYRHVRDYDS